MDFSSQAITYAMLLIPSFFAMTVIAQGIIKMTREEADGIVAVGIGIFLLILIAGAYWFFIR
ncbi:MAG: hypothetical protein AAB492_03985 [Patescibacteria group bacterium]